MSIVQAEIEIANSPVETFRIAQKVEDYPGYMPSVKSVEVLERRDDGYAKVAWTARVQIASIDKNVKWIEEEWWDEPNLTSRYALIEGDYKHYSGEWEFTPSGTGTHVRLMTDYDLGLPLVGQLIGKLLDKLMLDNLNAMLGAIKQKAENK